MSFWIRLLSGSYINLEKVEIVKIQETDSGKFHVQAYSNFWDGLPFTIAIYDNIEDAQDCLDGIFLKESDVEDENVSCCPFCGEKI